MCALSAKGPACRPTPASGGRQKSRDDDGGGRRARLAVGASRATAPCTRRAHSVPWRRGFRWHEETRAPAPSEGPRRRSALRLPVESLLASGDAREAAGGEHHRLEKKWLATKAATEDFLSHPAGA